MIIFSDITPSSIGTAIGSITQSSLQGIQLSITQLTSDSVITPKQKATSLIPLVAQLTTRYDLIISQVGVQLNTTPLRNARNSFNDYINSLQPAWNNLNSNSIVNRSTFNSRLSTYRQALQDLSDKWYSSKRITVDSQGVLSGIGTANIAVNNANLATDIDNAGRTAEWTNISSTPTQLTDGRIAAGLAANGDQNRPMPATIAALSDLVRGGAGGNITDLVRTRISAGFVGQGTGARANSLSQLNSAEGSKLSGIANQATRNTGSLANQNSITFGGSQLTNLPAFINPINLLNGFGRADFVRYPASNTLVSSLQPRQAGSDVTGSNTAAFLQGSGAGAYANNLADLDNSRAQKIDGVEENATFGATRDEANRIVRAQVTADGKTRTYFSDVEPFPGEYRVGTVNDAISLSMDFTQGFSEGDTWTSASTRLSKRWTPDSWTQEISTINRGAANADGLDQIPVELAAPELRNSNLLPNIQLAGRTAEWTSVNARPNNLTQLNPSEGNKLGGVDIGATFGARAGSNIFRADGSTVLQQNQIRTVEGTAAFLEGEGTLARQNSIDPYTQLNNSEIFSSLTWDTTGSTTPNGIRPFGQSLRKVSGTTGWVTTAITREKFTHGFVLRFSAIRGTPNNRYMLGLTDIDSITASGSEWQQLDFAWYSHITSLLSYRIYESGVDRGQFLNDSQLSPNDTFEIEYRDGDIVYNWLPAATGIKTEIRRVTVGPDLVYRIAFAGFDPSAEAGSISVSPLAHTKAASLADANDVFGSPQVGGLIPNGNFQQVNSAGLPLGFENVEGSFSVSYKDAQRSAVVISGAGFHGMGFPAIPLDPKTRYILRVRHRSSGASSTGFFLRFNALTTNTLLSGKTHIGVDSTAINIRQFRQTVHGFVSNGPMPGTEERTDDYIFNPNNAITLGSLSFYNWNSGVDYEIISVNLIPVADETRLNALQLINGPRQSNADVTSVNTAAFLEGSGAGAYANNLGQLNSAEGNKLSLVNELATSGSALNVGHQTDDLNKWWVGDNRGTPLLNSPTAVFSIETRADIPVGRSCIRMTENDTAIESFFSERMPFDITKTYKCSVWVRREGDRVFRLSFGCYDGNGARLLATETTGFNNGSLPYWPGVTSVVSSQWRYHEIIVGPNSPLRAAPNTKSFGIGFVGGDNGTQNSIFEFAGFKAEEVIAAPLSAIDSPRAAHLDGVDIGATRGARAGSNIFRTDGSTILQQNEIRTAEGTAAFLQGEGPGARAPAEQIFNHKNENGVLVISQPSGAAYSGTSVENGAIRIDLPQLWTNTMMRFNVEIYNYRTATSQTYMIGGYNNTGNRWINTFAQMIGQASDAQTVRFGSKSGKAAIWIGEPNSSWIWVSIRVINFTARHSNLSYSQWGEGWNISLDTSPAVNEHGTNPPLVITNPRAADAVFGFNTFEGVGGAPATLGNFKTNIGTAALLAGSGAGAYANNLGQLNAAEGNKLSGIEANADVTINAVRTIIPQFPIIEIREFDAGNAGVRQITHFIQRGGITISGGTWSLPQRLLGNGTATFNATNGRVSLSNITQSGSYTIKYTHTDNVSTTLVVNVSFIEAPPQSGGGGGTTGGTLTIISSVSVAEWFAGSTTSISVSHNAREDGVVLSGGTWSLVGNTTGLVSISTSGVAFITDVFSSGSYTIRYTLSDGRTVDRTINILFHPNDPSSPNPQL